jgi:hypothetical protein
MSQVTTCSPNPCTGACCIPSLGCALSPDGTQCTGVGGVFQGAATSCSPSPCPPPTGACCAGAACSITDQSACTGAFRGPGTACGPGVCCRADFNYSQTLSVQDIFDFLAAYFTLDPRADINGVGGVTVQDIFDFLGLYFTGC